MSERPNFLLIMTDQHRADHLSCYGNNVLETPHIDRIANEGAIFEQCYVATPAGMPNRASLMTGRMPSAHAVRYDGIPLHPGNVTFADLLAAEGYRTALIGTAALQNAQDRCPESTAAREGLRHRARYDQERASRWRSDPAHEVDLPYYGFSDVALVCEHGDLASGHYWRWLSARHPRPETLRGAKNALGDPTFSVPYAWRTAMPEELYPTTYVTEQTLVRLQRFAREPGRPFFLTCSFPDPHPPFTPPGYYWGVYQPADIPARGCWHLPEPQRMPPPLRWLHEQRHEESVAPGGPGPFACTLREAREAIALTYGMIQMIDDGVGRILDRLEQLGLAENTVVIFTSDHGDFMGDHGLLLKGPLHYRGLIRVPLIWREPGRGPKRRIGGLASTIDITATILARAGLEPYIGIQGSSLIPLMSEEKGEGRECVLIEDESDGRRVGSERHIKLRSLLDGRFRMTLYADHDWGELYDLQEDPQESVNLWDDPSYAVVRGHLAEMMAERMMAASQTGPAPDGHG